MQRPKWLSGWGDGKNFLEARLLIETPDIQVVEASFDKRLLFFAVGTPKKNEKAFSLPGSDKGNDDDSIRAIEWKVFYDTTVFPKSMQINQTKHLMNAIILACSGKASVYNPDTVYVASGDRTAKGNAPHLLDYEMAKKIEKSKREQSS